MILNVFAYNGMCVWVKGHVFHGQIILGVCLRLFYLIEFNSILIYVSIWFSAIVLLTYIYLFKRRFKRGVDRPCTFHIGTAVFLDHKFLINVLVQMFIQFIRCTRRQQIIIILNRPKNDGCLATASHPLSLSELNKFLRQFSHIWNCHKANIIHQCLWWRRLLALRSSRFAVS